MRSSKASNSSATPAVNVAVHDAQVLTVAELIMRSRRDGRTAVKYLLTLGALTAIYLAALVASMLAISSPFWRTAVAIVASVLFIVLMANAQRVLRRL
ncbi:MAG: hypothetical protein ABUL47_01750 [Leifsonia sp.]|jgi:hypothetical protein